MPTPSVLEYSIPYSYEDLYESARPFFDEICHAFMAISVDDLERSTHGMLSTDEKLIDFLPFLNLPPWEQNEIKGEGQARDLLRVYCGTLCIYILAMTNQQIEKLPFARFKDENAREEYFKYAVSAGLRHKEVKLLEVFEKTKEKWYSEKVTVFGQTLFERISTFVEISEAADTSDSEGRLKKALLADDKYDGDRLFAHAEAKAVGKMFARARDAAGLNKLQASKATGVAAKNLRQIERGDRSPALDTMHKLADGLGYKVEIKLIPKDNE